MKHFLYKTLTISFWLLAVSVPANATFTLKHRMGVVELPSGEGQDALILKSGQQVVHVDSVIIYSRPDANVTCARPDKKPFTTYVRWYNYDTDSVVPGLTNANNTYPFAIKNPRGWFKTNMSSSQNYEVKFVNKNQEVIRIAADMSAYANYEWTVNGEDTTVIEPTLSKRLIYVFRPAQEIAARVDTCKNNDSYLEVHEMMAPTGRQLYIGPDYPIFTKGSNYCNYHFNAASTKPTQMNPSGNQSTTKWKWTVVGGESVYLNTLNTPDANTIINGQYKSASSNVAGVVTYLLQYEQSTTEIYNIAKFIVTYKNVSEVGPSTSVSSPELTSKMELLYEQNFNFNRPGTTALTYYTDKHIPVEESSYGCYYQDIAFIGGLSPTQRPNTRSDLTSGEYGICNWQDIYSQSKCIYNHVEGHANTKNDAKEGYFLYVDGSDKQGEVFSLEVNADLCPGSTMYFYAWLIDGSTKDRSAPNMDFIVIGEDTTGIEHILTTYTTGEFGWNALEDVSGSTKMQLATWYQVMFPVYIDQDHIYPRYELKIMNKGLTNDGNDFAIDDIRVYAQRPPVMPLQASTAECVDKAIDTITAYLRVDYQEIGYEEDSLFFQWRDEKNAVLLSDYYNVYSPDITSKEYGRVPVKQESEITAADTCSSLLSFDSKFHGTDDTTIIRYIREKVNLTDTRYVMYIAMPLVVRPNHTYTSFVSPLLSHLGSRKDASCGTFADLLVSGGTRITINDEITSGEVVDVCGHRTYDLNIVLTQVIQDYSTENLRVDTFRCKADWLIGDSTYVDAHQVIYRNTFKDIQKYLGWYHTNPNQPDAKTAVEYLQRQGLLILDTFGISMTPELSLSYTAFPTGTVKMQDDTEVTVCSMPRFLHIQPKVDASNMMVVGDPDEDKNALPDVVKDRPRIVRISDAQKRKGWFDLPLYLIGDENERYEVDVIYTISSNAPNWQRITLNSNKPVIALKDTIRLSSEELKSIEAGYDYTFHIAFIGESDEDKCDRGYTYFTLRIVPDVVTWYGGDWNTDANWDYFIPMDSTSVILRAQDYHVTFEDNPNHAEAFDFNYTRNQCKNIYIPANASMAGQENLVIKGTAYVDIPVPAQKWALMSMPIKGIVSGDLFVSQNESTDPFTVASIVHGETVDEAIDRTVYEVYDSPYDAAHNTWIRPDSILDQPILPMDAIMIGTDCASGSADPVIRLPKPDNYYLYYDFNTNLWLTEDKTITADLRTQLGKPAWNGESTVTLTRAYNNMYMLGNPTFGYIDLTQLMADNEGKLTGEYFMTPAEGTSDPTIDLATIDPSAAHVFLPPCRGVLLKGNGADELTITINVTTPSAPSTPAPKRRVQSPLTSFDAQGGMPIGAIISGSIVEVHETDLDIAEVFAAHNNSTIPTLHLYRTLWRDGYYNTLCLPFDQSAEDIDAGPLHGAQVYKFLNAEKVGENQLDIYVEDTTGIKAGVPYLVIWENQGNTIPQPLVFNNVLIKTNKGDTIGASNKVVRFAGNIPIGTVELYNENHLFIGANNQLYWPEYDTRMKGFRAHFRVPTKGPAAVPKNTPSRIVVRHQTATGIESVQPSEVSVQKIIIDGNVYIVRDGKMYSILGQTIQ